MFIVSLFLAVGAMAQIDTNQEYRLKDVSTGLYLNAANHDEHSGGTHGGVNVADKAENDDQIFSFEKADNGYYLKTRVTKREESLKIEISLNLNIDQLMNKYSLV